MQCSAIGFVKGKEGKRVTLQVQTRKKSATRKHFAKEGDVWCVPSNLTYCRDNTTQAWSRVIKHTTSNKNIWLYVRHVYKKTKSSDNSDEVQEPVRAPAVASPAPAPAPAGPVNAAESANAAESENAAESANAPTPAPPASVNAAESANSVANANAPAPAGSGLASDAAPATSSMPVVGGSRASLLRCLYITLCI